MEQNFNLIGIYRRPQINAERNYCRRIIDFDDKWKRSQKETSMLLIGCGIAKIQMQTVKYYMNG